MDDFLGTSIQYSEQQILKLEKEHAANLEKTVEELINSGFLDSDYEESDTAETEYSDNESSEYNEEIKENLNESPFIEAMDDSEMTISPKSNSPSSSLTFTSDNDDNNNDEELKEDYKPNDNLALVLAENSSNGEFEDFDLSEFKSLGYLLEIIFSDIKSLMILFILMVALPHILQRGDERTDGYGAGGFQYQNDYDFECGHSAQQHQQHQHHEEHRQFLRQTSIHWFWEPLRTQQHKKQHDINNDEEDERDEYQEQCKNQQHILNFDIMTTTLDANTNKIYAAKLYHHEIKIRPSDLLCNHHDNNDNDKTDIIPTTTTTKTATKTNNIPQELPRLFLQFGAGLKSPQMIRIFKETLPGTVGRQFARTHGLTALVMSFVGIAAFAVGTNTGFDEYITMSS